MTKKICPHCGHELDLKITPKTKKLEKPVAASTLGQNKQLVSTLGLGIISLGYLIIYT
jgi:hypothetical protein